MRDFFLDFEYLAEGLCWYLLEAIDFAVEEFLAFCMVFASIEELIGFLFFQIKVS